MKISFLVILSLILFQCGKQEARSIEIIVKDNAFTVNGELIQADSLEKTLRQEKMKFGDPPPTIVIKVAPDTKRGILADLETILRRLNFRKIHYIDYDRSKSS